MTEADEVPNLVDSDGLEIEPARLAGRKRGPRKIELKNTSDSTRSPVTTSTTNDVAPRTRSRSGCASKPNTERLSSSEGSADVNPPN
jgi:hypothetical protein